jgi:hypothetical protein
MNSSIKFCEINTKDNQYESIILNNLKIITNLEGFSLKFIQGETVILLKTTGIFLSYMYYEKRINIQSFHNKLFLNKNNVHNEIYNFNLLECRNTVKFNCKINSANKNIKILFAKNNNNIITYDINSPYQYPMIGKDMLYYQVKIFDDFDIIYNFYSFKILYHIKNDNVYEILYKNNKISICLINNGLIDYNYYHKTLYNDKIIDKKYFERMWIDRGNNICLYQITKNNNYYDVIIKAFNLGRKFVLCENNTKIKLLVEDFIQQDYKNIKSFLKFLKSNFFTFLYFNKL